MIKLKVVTALVVALAATSVFADHYSDFYVIPAAAHAPGANNTNFQSDVAIHNFQSSPLTVELIFIEAGEGNGDNVFPLTGTTVNGSVTVPANGTVLLRDVLAGYPKGSITGGILVGSDRPFAVSSRTYNNATGGSFGQTVVAARDFLDNASGRTDNAAAVAYIPGVVSNARYRTNIGLVAANLSNSAQAVVVRFGLRNAAGAEIGVRNVIVEPGSIMQLQFGSTSLSNTPFDAGTVEVRIVQGNGAVVPYASVIDNQSGDGTFISAQFPENAPMANAKSPHRSTFRQFFDEVRSSY